jgi:hypothetical protein
MTKLLPSKIYNARKNNISLHTDTEVISKSNIIKSSKHKDLQPVKSDAIVNNKLDPKNSSGSFTIKRPMADTPELDELEKENDLKDGEPPKVEKKVSIKKITKLVQAAKPKNNKRIDIKKLAQKLVSGNQPQEQVKIEEVKVDETVVKNVKIEEVKEAPPTLKTPKIEQKIEKSDEELESEEEESEEEDEIPKSKLNVKYF